LAQISGVTSTGQCNSCEDANESYSLEPIPCENVGCGWYAFGHCGSFYGTCGDVTLIELDIESCLVQGQFHHLLMLLIQLTDSTHQWEQRKQGSLNCAGPFTFTSADYVGVAHGECDLSQATITLEAASTNPCLGN
jgi:hypothetical protein